MSPTDEDFSRMIKGDNAHNSITGWTGMSGTAMPGWSDFWAMRTRRTLRST